MLDQGMGIQNGNDAVATSEGSTVAGGGFAAALQSPLRWPNAATLAVSLAYTLIIYMVCSAAFYAHGVNDDWALCNALSGRWGDPQGITLFINALLCQVIEWLNVNVGVLNWFFVLEYATGFVSFFALTYVSLRNFRLPFAGLLIGAFTFLLIPNCTWKVNFTCVAAAACCAGLMMLLVSLGRERHAPSLVAGGLALVLVGILWRMNIFLVAIPVFGIAALFQLRIKAKQGKAVPAFGLFRLWPFVMALVIMGGTLAYHGVVWGDEALNGWYNYNEARSAFSDYPKKSYDEVADELATIGVSKTDYEMLESWITEDPAVFTEDSIKAVNSVVIKSNETTIATVGYTCARYAYRLVKDVPLACFIALSVVCSALLARGQARRFGLLMIVLAYVLGVAFLVVGRLPERVNYPLWLYAFSCIGCLVGRDAPPLLLSGHHTPSSAVKMFCSTALAVLCLIAPFASAAYDLGKAAPRLSTQKLQAVFAVNDFEAHSPLLDYLDQNPQAILVVNTGTNFDIVYANLMTAPASPQAVQRVIGLGGWATRSPYVDGRNKRAGMENPIKGLVENDSAIYVASSDKTVKLLKDYLRERYYPKAAYEQVGELDSWNGEAKLKLFKFYDGG